MQCMVSKHSKWRYIVEIRELQEHMRTLMQVGEARDPVISAYLNTRAGADAAAMTFADRVELLERAIADSERPAFEDAADRSHGWLRTSTLR